MNNWKRFLWYLPLLAGAGSAEVLAAIIKVACVGDSITYGEGIPQRVHQAYPVVLQQLLGDGYQVSNFGISGSNIMKNGTLPYWEVPAFQAASEAAPGIVIIMLGTNDSRIPDRFDLETLAADAEAFIRHFQDLPSRPQVYLALPPPIVGTFTFASNRILRQQIIPALQKAAQRTGTTTIDIYQAFGDREDLFLDGIHPSAEGARLIATTIYQALLDHHAIAVDKMSATD